MGDFGEKKTVYSCFPEWGRYGVAITYKPEFVHPETGKKYTHSVMFSEVMRDTTARDGHRFTTRPLNQRQRENGKYNPHASFPFDVIPQILAALLSIRQDFMQGDGESVEGFPQAEAVADEFRGERDAIDTAHDMATMSEFATPGQRPVRKPPSTPKPIEDEDDLPF